MSDYHLLQLLGTPTCANFIPLCLWRRHAKCVCKVNRILKERHLVTQWDESQFMTSCDQAYIHYNLHHGHIYRISFRLYIQQLSPLLNYLDIILELLTLWLPDIEELDHISRSMLPTSKLLIYRKINMEASVGATYGLHLYEGCRETFLSSLCKHKTLQMQYFLFKKSIPCQDVVT